MAIGLWTCAAHAGGVCGNGEPDPGEACDDGNMVDGDGCSSACQIESGLYFCTSALPATPPANLLRDGSFENSNIDGEWAVIEHSLFGELICGPDCFSIPLASDIDGNIVGGNYVLVSGGRLIVAVSRPLHDLPLSGEPYTQESTGTHTQVGHCVMSLAKHGVAGDSKNHVIVLCDSVFNIFSCDLWLNKLSTISKAAVSSIKY